MSEHDFKSPSVEAFLDRLGSASPTPGGGTAAAVTGAVGASLVGMLANLTLGREKYADHEKLMTAIAEQAEEERMKLLELAADDAAAYAKVGAAYKLPRDTDEAKAARGEAIQAALKGACDVPLATMERCVEVIGLAKTAVQYGNKNAISDGAAGSEFARAALRVASYNVKVNLGSIKDAEYAKQARTRMDEMDYMGANAATWIDSHVNELWSS